MSKKPNFRKLVRWVKGAPRKKILDEAETYSDILKSGRRPPKTEAKKFFKKRKTGRRMQEGYSSQSMDFGGVPAGSVPSGIYNQAVNKKELAELEAFLSTKKTPQRIIRAMESRKRQLKQRHEVWQGKMLRKFKKDLARDAMQVKRDQRIKLRHKKSRNKFKGITPMRAFKKLRAKGIKTPAQLEQFLKFQEKGRKARKQ